MYPPPGAEGDPLSEAGGKVRPGHLVRRRWLRSNRRMVVRPSLAIVTSVHRANHVRLSEDGRRCAWEYGPAAKVFAKDRCLRESRLTLTGLLARIAEALEGNGRVRCRVPATAKLDFRMRALRQRQWLALPGGLAVSRAESELRALRSTCVRRVASRGRAEATNEKEIVK